MDSSEDKKRKNLGRGLSALFGDDDSNTDIEKDIHLYSSSREEISIDDIVPNPYQPREYFDCSELEGLVASIKEKGIIQPIIVRKAENCDGLYQIIAGERRWKASKIAGLKMIPTVIRESGDEEMLSLAMIENIQRSNLNPIEEAKGFDAMLKVNNTQKEISSIVGKSRSYVANSLRLLTLPRDVQKFLESNDITIGHARALIPSKIASELVKIVIAKKLNVRETEKLVYSTEISENKIATVSHKNLSPFDEQKNIDVAVLEKDLGARLNMKVGIIHNSDGKGEVRIYYKTLAELDEVCKFFD